MYAGIYICRLFVAGFKGPFLEEDDCNKFTKQNLQSHFMESKLNYLVV
jgi:hypothetical protein